MRVYRRVRRRLWLLTPGKARSEFASSFEGAAACPRRPFFYFRASCGDLAASCKQLVISCCSSATSANSSACIALSCPYSSITLFCVRFLCDRVICNHLASLYGGTVMFIVACPECADLIWLRTNGSVSAGVCPDVSTVGMRRSRMVARQRNALASVLARPASSAGRLQSRFFWG
ncbi:hypothetical protein [Blackfly microvirus SF02]|uniref:Uncharacterized protein n=1 Tax=Blackfly microvirus SF02 TaxID=2576452 RepID=A0A4P8PL47_9VIRU|nr:hypothetical protein [Blackfly microvirus SF02]